VFWYGACILLGLHALAGSVLLVFFPTLLHKLGSFLTVIVVSDLLLTHVCSMARYDCTREDIHLSDLSLMP
jgi:hypothetical protein